jgi:hypothetical protein
MDILLVKVVCKGAAEAAPRYGIRRGTAASLSGG